MEVDYNTDNAQYRPTEYSNYVKYREENVVKELQEKITHFQLDIIFWSAISSHIHGEGEYVNIQYGYELLNSVKSDALMITAGLQPTALGKGIIEIFPNVDIFIRGESEFVLLDLAENIGANNTNSDSPRINMSTFGNISIIPFPKAVGCKPAVIISASDFTELRSS
jgi:hypothetical protein